MITHQNNLFNITTKNSSYVMAYSNCLQNIYWGEKLHGEDLSCYVKERGHSSFDPNLNLERDEYGFWNSYSFLESCLKVNYPEIRKLDMVYLEHSIQQVNEKLERLTLRFKNSYSQLYADVVYEVYAEYDIICRYAKITNEGEEVILENLKSASVSIPKLEKYRVKYLTGKWAAETQVNDQYLTTGAFTLQSRCGNTGPHYNPSFALDDGTADETRGSVWFGLLGYSSNWQITFERTVYNNVRVTGGISNFDFSYRLGKGESITTPVMTFGYSAGGYGEMSRKLHDFEVDHIFPRRKPGRVLYNSWEATAFDVTAKNQKELARRAAQIGVELFVIDDGWFGERHNDRAGLGDWYVNKEKFPNGLSEIIDYVKSLGMDFGIWVEPEAVNPDSDLYRAHPDWIYRFKDQEPMQGRNQYTLNISKKEVKEFIISFMSDLLSKHEDITFIKWDMNKTLTDVSAGDTAKDKELWYGHAQALYEIWATLRERFPKVDFEVCAGGGSRIDLGILQFADQCWPSDNTDAYERLFIQEGFSYFYAPRIMTAWVTDSSSGCSNKFERPYSYRFHSSMMGGLGIGANISKFSEETLEEFKNYISLYKEIRETVQYGKQYRLSSVRESTLHAVEYISRDDSEVVVFAFRQGYEFGKEMPSLKLCGLDSQALYQIEGDDRVLHGSTLMRMGLETGLWGDFDSRFIRIRRV
ncbi:alpha-galactosidase [Anaerotaenia torta]|uniref:alpha-galactosidase n=1 Tax=Anaerotaenia torta TaxID=433293 RepID=UPI003D1F689C